MLTRNGGRDQARSKERHAVGCLQVKQSEYINDYGAISCPFKLLSPVLSK